MSYILEALRRSQAERERGQVPGLNAQPAAVAALPSRPEGPPWRWLLPAAAGGVAMLALAVWAWRGPAAPAAPAVPGAGPALAPAPVPAPVPSPAAAALPLVVSAPPAPAPAPAAAVPVTAAAAPAPAPGPRTVRLADLSAEQRRELPPLSLGGSVWSESALSRFVIVNGQVVREGDTAAPGVVVERIGPKAVLLRWRELRLEISI